jgi:hypothetical protein
MTDEIEVTALMPCLNEAETLGVCVDKALASLARLGVRGEVLVSDNGSTDGSQDIARSHGARVVHAPIRGYGGALIAGIEAARGKYVIMADADDSYDLTDLGPFIEQLRAGNDVVMGNRFKGGIAKGAMPPLHRYLGNPVLSWLGRALFGLKQVGDFHCGIRGFDRSRVVALGLRMPGMEFASELVVRAALAGYRIVEVPTSLQPDGRSRKPHLRTWRDGWRHLRFLLVFAPKFTLVVPGALLALVGLAATVALLLGPVTIAGLRFDNAALVYSCLAVLVGVQLLLVGGCAKLYTATRSAASVPKPLWMRVMSLEVLMTTGLALTIAGLAGTAVGLSVWKATGFGQLNAQRIIHLVVPSATTIAIGIGTIFTGLLASLLTLDRVSPGADTRPDADEGRPVAADARGEVEAAPLELIPTVAALPPGIRPGAR